MNRYNPMYIIPALALLLLVSLSCEDNSQVGSRSSTPSYTIAAQDSWTTAGIEYVELRVRVHSTNAPNDQQILDIGNELFSRHSSYDRVRVFIYASNDDIESVAYARMDYSDGTLVEAVAFGDATTW